MIKTETKWKRYLASLRAVHQIHDEVRTIIRKDERTYTRYDKRGQNIELPFALLDSFDLDRMQLNRFSRLWNEETIKFLHGSLNILQDESINIRLRMVAVLIPEAFGLVDPYSNNVALIDKLNQYKIVHGDMRKALFEDGVIDMDPTSLYLTVCHFRDDAVISGFETAFIKLRLSL